MVLDFLEGELLSLRRRGLLREDAGVAAAEGLLDACSNDYLGYAREIVSRETLDGLAGTHSGAGASRLIHGTAAAHLALECAVADWVRLPAALLFTSGYAANLGVLTALPGPNDLIVSDALNHASIIDGCRLSKATVAVYPHLDHEAARAALRSHPTARRRWLVTESYFSMDGDSPDLPALSEACRDAGAALIVDEAHGLGVHGPSGAGVCASRGVVPNVLVGTLGKAVGAQGAFVAGTNALRSWLWNCARSHVFTTAPSPLMTQLAAANVARARADESARAQLLELHALFVGELRARDRRVPAHAPGPIVPVIIGANDHAVEVAERVVRRGFLVQAIRPPTVPDGSARLRVTLHATMTADQTRGLACAIADACDES